ncbi:phage tail tape measure protein [Cognatishimia sp. SS12]|uniref:phage tail tape measure protein n=1 Tax=Cognatishimia sp. SS12 TaxID=2979465 RepID=UPI00232C501B|nr:phage tail tape measure protein [Cognatishimia sp. SS12]MDC0737527.1 phage tail tape measure protein [Cognatishimia sp. SS12]
MTDTQHLQDVDSQLEAISGSAAATSADLSAFSAELGRMGQRLQKSGGDLKTLETGLTRGLKGAVKGMVQQGDSLGDALRQVVQSVQAAAFDAALTPVTKQVGGMMAQGIGQLVAGILPFENGAAFSQGRVRAFANGGIVSGATAFPMRGGLGLMGEAGPEAILPLARGRDGKLGVQSAGGAGRPVTVVMNIQTPDAPSFQRSRSQIAAQMSRALLRGQRGR